jgi:glycosyltransferase involved in cell wall biosynthesis
VVLIAGKGPLEQELRVECEKRGLGGQVRFCGAREDILDLYNAGDAFVMSSEFEGLSVALLEAAAVGLPTVVTDVGGNSDVVIDGVTGHVVPAGAPAQLAAAMQRVMEASPECRQTMGSAARQHCHANFRIAVIMDQWLELYNSCLPVAPACCGYRRDLLPAGDGIPSKPVFGLLGQEDSSATNIMDLNI